MRRSGANKTNTFRSIKIDRVLKKDNDIRKREIQLLLAGTSKSGKNTLAKQLRIHFGDGFPATTRQEAVPIIFANLTDAVISVLERMTQLRIEFADKSTKELCNRLLDIRPPDGYLMHFLADQNPNSGMPLADFSRVVFPSGSPPRSANDGEKTPVTHNKTLSSMVNSVSSMDTSSHSGSTNLSSSFTNEEIQSLREAFVWLVNDANSIPPSLLKKLEYFADRALISDDLRTAFSDTNKLRVLFLRFFSANATKLSEHLTGGDSPPPSPVAPPPLSIEEDLLQSILAERDIEPGLDSSSSDSTEHHLSDSSIRSLNINPNNKLSPLVSNAENNLLPSMPTDRIQSNALTRISTNNYGVENVSSKLPTGPSDSWSTGCLYQVKPGRTDNSSSRGVASVGALRVVLKTITDQPEFTQAVDSQQSSTSRLSHGDTYLISHVDRIIQEDYVPTLQDILVMRHPSKAIRESQISVASTTVKAIDLAEQMINIKKYLHYFECVNVVIFMVSLVDCYKEAQRANDKNGATTSVNLFSRLLNSPYMSRKYFVIFLNKFDQLKEHISVAERLEACGSQSDATSNFILNVKERFLQAGNKVDPKAARIRFYVSCALDVDEMKWTLRDLLRSVFEWNRKRYALL